MSSAPILTLRQRAQAESNVIPLFARGSLRPVKASVAKQRLSEVRWKLDLFEFVRAKKTLSVTSHVLSSCIALAAVASLLLTFTLLIGKDAQAWLLIVIVSAQIAGCIAVLAVGVLKKRASSLVDDLQQGFAYCGQEVALTEGYALLVDSSSYTVVAKVPI